MSRDSRQLPLALPHRPALGRDDFMVADSNRAAIAWLDRWPDWPAPALVLHGPEGAGKTHLAAVFAARTRASVVDGATLAPGCVPALLEDGPAVVEDADRAPLDETALFHLFNLARETGTPILLTARGAPGRWPLTLPDLRSRLTAVPAVAIAPPDDALLSAVLVKLFADRQLSLGTEALAYLLPRIDRDFATARRLAETVDAKTLAEKRAVTIPLLREVLESNA